MNNASQKTGLNLEPKLGGFALLVLAGGCLLVLRPFVSALLWATVLSFASWPFHRQVLRLVRNRRTLAALITSLAMVLLFLTPFIIVGVTLADNVNELTAAVKKVAEEGPPAPPQWLGKVPLVGQKAVDSWEAVASDSGTLFEHLKAWIPRVSGWLLAGGLLLGQGLMQLALSIFIAFFLFRDGVAVAERLNATVERIGGERGVRLLTVAGKTIRGVVYGILGTALAQAVLAGIGYLIAGVPGAAFLALMTFFASVVPIVGAGLVWLPAALWLFDKGSTGWGIFMLVWGLGVSNVDNVIKPWIISHGSNMPFILIFFGVLGGALAFGFIGVFLGPTLLAVGYRLVVEWHAEPRDESNLAPASGAPGKTT